MKPNHEQIWLALVTAIFLNASLLHGDAQPGSVPVLTLPNGAQLVFAGTTYGTTNTPPSPEKYIGQHNIQFNEGETFETPRLFVWFQWKETNAQLGRTMPTLIARLADQKGVERGVNSYPAFSDGVPWSYAAFPVIPRRSQMLQCNFYSERADFDRSLKPVASISFTNPLYGHFSEWKPEALPTVRIAGDLEVRLENLEVQLQTTSTGVRQGKPFASKGGNLETFFDVSLKSARGTNEAWMVQSAELSDATGNVLRGFWLRPENTHLDRTTQSPSDGWARESKSFWATLWPEEAAWRLKLELKRSAGLAQEELVTFRNVPLLKSGATNSIWMTNTAGPFQVIIEEHTRWDPYAAKYYGLPKFRLQVPGAPDDLTANVVQVTTATGAEVHIGWGTDLIPGKGKTPSEREPFVFLLPVPTNATTVNVVCAVQKIRSVEFRVKPPLTD